MNPDLQRLHPYPFEKLRELLKDCQTPKQKLIKWSIGEPRHEPPGAVLKTLRERLPLIARYPLTKGLPELRQSIAHWLRKRYHAELDPETHILPCNGTREALFSFTQACIDKTQGQRPLVVMPNPFYQIYEGAALLAGAEPYYLPCFAHNQYLPNFEAVPDEVWQRCQLLFLCSPGNPSGAVLPRETLTALIQKADQFDFLIASDECYSEIYLSEQHPPAGLLEAAAAMGRQDFKRCVVFHSLSKRSNLPGLRSGFVAGDADAMAQYLTYRTYHGCAMPFQHQHASAAAWSDEAHVVANRELYREKFARVVPSLKTALDVKTPPASFYLWVPTPIDDQEFTRRLFEQQHLLVLPGSYLSREIAGQNPGQNHIRIALVSSLPECLEACERLLDFVKTL